MTCKTTTVIGNCCVLTGGSRGTTVPWVGNFKTFITFRYPSNFKVNRNKEMFDTDPDWPSSRFCKEADPRFPDHIEAVYPVFLPFENKGIK